MIKRLRCKHYIGIDSFCLNAACIGACQLKSKDGCIERCIFDTIQEPEMMCCKGYEPEDVDTYIDRLHFNIIQLERRIKKLESDMNTHNHRVDTGIIRTNYVYTSVPEGTITYSGVIRH